MKYTVKFEMHSDLDGSANEVLHHVRKALCSTFGNVENLEVGPVTTYIGYIQQDQSITWKIVAPNR